jgi:hypothetical protein
MEMEYRATITVHRPRPISHEEYSAVLGALERRHDELGPVGGGGSRDTAVFVMSTDRYDLPAPAAGEMIEAVIEALGDVGVADAWPVNVELEAIEPDPEREPRKVAVG